MKQRRQLKTHRTRVRIVNEQKLKPDVRPQDSWISRSIRDRTIGNLKQDTQTRLQISSRSSQTAAQKLYRLNRPLHPSPDLKKTPSQTSCRVFCKQSRKGRKRDNDIVEQIQSSNVALIRTRRCETGKLRFKLLEHAPGNGRQRFLQMPCDASQFLEIPTKARHL